MDLKISELRLNSAKIDRSGGFGDSEGPGQELEEATALGTEEGVESGAEDVAPTGAGFGLTSGDDFSDTERRSPAHGRSISEFDSRLKDLKFQISDKRKIERAEAMGRSLRDY